MTVRIDKISKVNVPKVCVRARANSFLVPSARQRQHHQHNIYREWKKQAINIVSNERNSSIAFVD